jgi:hypothetical protein
MRKFSTSLCLIFTASFLAASASPAAQSKSLDERLADRDYRIGEEVERVVDYRIDGRVYLDSSHLVVPDGSSKNYLVTLTDSCSGLHSNRIIVRARTTGQLAANDRLLIKHEGRTVDHCYVKTIHGLDNLGSE